MPILSYLPQIFIIVFIPYLWMRLTKRWGVEQWLSPVVLAYATGIILANVPILPLSKAVSEGFVSGTVLLAIPLLLFATDLKGWVRYARSSVLSFVLCVISGMLVSALVGWWFRDQLTDAWRLSGMLVGIYTGGTANVNAIGLAVGADSELLVLISAADIFCGGIYLVFLTSVAKRLFSRFLPPFQADTYSSVEQTQVEKEAFRWSFILKPVGLTILIIAASLGLCQLLTGELKALGLIILALTTLSIVASLYKSVRDLPYTFEMGEYLLLMFCVAIGMEADFGQLMHAGGEVILFTSCVLLGTVMLHLLLARLFRIDVDTVIITSTAALYSPVFVGQIASAIRNRSLIFSGMATGLVGFALGNYLGIFIAFLVKNLGG